MKKDKIRPLQYVRFDVMLHNGYLIFSVPDLLYGYVDGKISPTTDELIIFINSNYF